jgi:hypothetical protein
MGGIPQQVEPRWAKSFLLATGWWFLVEGWGSWKGGRRGSPPHRFWDVDEWWAAADEADVPFGSASGCIEERGTFAIRDELFVAPSIQPRQIPLTTRFHGIFASQDVAGA